MGVAGPDAKLPTADSGSIPVDCISIFLMPGRGCWNSLQSNEACKDAVE